MERRLQIQRRAGKARAISRRLRRLERELDRQGAERSDLLAQLSHELRTPLASLRGYLDTLLLKDGSLPAEERRRFLEIAARQSERLGDLVADLLELARLQSPDFRIQTEPVHLAELARDLVQERAAAAAGISLTLDASARLPAVRADIALIEGALARLIDAAVHSSARGDRVALAIRRRARHVTLELACSAARASGGDAIVNRILELHGSRLTMEPFAERGTRLSFSLPIA